MQPPDILHRVETHAGGLSWTLANDPEGYSEVVNDVCGEITNFWNVMADDGLFARFQRKISACPFTEFNFNKALSESENCRTLAARGFHFSDQAAVHYAWCFFIRARMSMAARMRNFTPLSRNRVRRGMNEQAAGWLSSVDGLAEVHARLRRVVILNRDALAVLKEQDGPKTLFYVDPPYLHETRTAKDVYNHEMTAEQHKNLLLALASVKGKFLLSGYQSKLYDLFSRSFGWHCTTFDVPNHSSSGETKPRMAECVWRNYDIPKNGKTSSSQ